MIDVIIIISALAIVSDSANNRQNSPAAHDETFVFRVLLTINFDRAINLQSDYTWLFVASNM